MPPSPPPTCPRPPSPHRPYALRGSLPITSQGPVTVVNYGAKPGAAITSPLPRRTLLVLVMPTHREGKADPGRGGGQGVCSEGSPRRTLMIKGEAAVDTVCLVSGLPRQPCKAGRARYHYPHFTDERLRLAKASGDLSKLAEMDSNPWFSNSGSGTFSAALLPAHVSGLTKITRGPASHQARGRRQCVHPLPLVGPAPSPTAGGRDLGRQRLSAPAHELSLG